MNPARRLKTLLAIVAVCSISAVAWLYYSGMQTTLLGRGLFLTDFTPTYGAALLITDLPAGELYVPDSMIEYTKRAGLAAYDQQIPRQAVERMGFSPWMYPPIFILPMVPLGLLGYWGAWWIWTLTSAAAFIAALRRTLSFSNAILLALAAPPTFFNLMYGQTGFLTAGLIGLGLTFIRSRPIVAGILIGAASFKPHFGLLIPFALIAGGHRKTFWSAAATVLALIIVSGMVFGIETWQLFFHAMDLHLDGFRKQGFSLPTMISPLSTFLLLGFSLPWAWSLQLGLSIACATLTVKVWKSAPQVHQLDQLKFALLCTTTLIAAPMSYLYDAVLLIPAWAWLWIDLKRSPLRRPEAIALTISAAGLYVVAPLAYRTGLQLGPMVVLGTLWVLVARVREASTYWANHD